MMIDFHTHILPGIDDGSADLDTSVEMIRQELSQGVQTVCLTPHFLADRDYPEQFLQQRNQSFQQLSTAVREAGLEIHMILGAEVKYCPGMSKWETLKDLTLGGSRYILIEPPARPWTVGLYRELEQIYQDQDLVPILAHIDRYLIPLRNRKLLQQLETLPVLLQANCDAFLRTRIRSTMLRLLKQRRIDLLGSDCHSATWRCPNMKSAAEVIESRLGKAALSDMQTYATRVLENRI